MDATFVELRKEYKQSDIAREKRKNTPGLHPEDNKR